MATSIFKLLGEIFVDNEKANEELDKTSKKAKKTGSDMGAAFGNITKGAAAVGTAVVGAAAAVGTAAFKMAESTAATTDEIDKQRQALGMSVKGYQEWRYVLSQNGADINNLGTAMKTITKTMAEYDSSIKSSSVDTVKLGNAQTKAANASLEVQKSQIVYNEAVKKSGANSADAQKAALALEKAQNNLANAQMNVAAASGPVKEKLSDAALALQKLGVQTVNANGEMRSSEEVFADTVKALQGIDNETEKATLAQKIYGKSYQELMPLLNQTAEGTDELTQRAHDLGLVLSEETVNSGVAFGDLLDDVKASIGAIGTKLGASAMPIIQKVLNFILDKIPMVQKLFENLTPVFTTMFDEVIPPLMELIETLLPSIIDLVIQLLPTISSIISNVLPIIVDFIEMIMPKLLEIIEKILPVLMDLINKITPVFDALMTALGPILDVVMAFIEPILDVVSEILPPLLDILLPPLILLLQSISPILEAMMPLVKNLGELFAGKLGAAFESIAPIITNLITILSGLINFITGVFTADWDMAFAGLVDIFKGAFQSIPLFLEGIVNGAISILNGLIDGVNFISEPLGLGKIGRIGKVDFTPFNNKKKVSAGSVKDRKGQSISAMAEGGTTLTRGTVLVGERGPELLNLPSGATVTPLNKTGGVTINFYDSKMMKPDDMDYFMDLMTKRLKQVGIA